MKERAQQVKEQHVKKVHRRREYLNNLLSFKIHHRAPNLIYFKFAKGGLPTLT